MRIHLVRKRPLGHAEKCRACGDLQPTHRYWLGEGNDGLLMQCVQRPSGSVSVKRSINEQHSLILHSYDCPSALAGSRSPMVGYRRGDQPSRTRRPRMREVYSGLLLFGTAAIAPTTAIDRAPRQRQDDAAPQGIGSAHAAAAVAGRSQSNQEPPDGASIAEIWGDG
jgi:hypothetical protein